MTPAPRHSERRFTSSTLAMALAAVMAASFSAGVSAQGSLPQAHTQGSLRYSCGGIGLDESTAMRAAMKEHPLSLLFAAAGGAYEADVRVTVKPEGAGEPHNFTASGPICLLNLPAGRYAVEAEMAGKTQRQSVEVGKSPRTLDFRF